MNVCTCLISISTLRLPRFLIVARNDATKNCHCISAVSQIEPSLREGTTKQSPCTFNYCFLLRLPRFLKVARNDATTNRHCILVVSHHEPSLRGGTTKQSFFYLKCSTCKDKSFQSGFCWLIKSSFFILDPAFICFSLYIASSILLNSS